MMTEICHSIIMRVPLFSALSVTFTHRLSEVVSLRSYPAAEWVVRKGRVGS